VLHAVGGAIPERLGQLPTIFPRHRAQQATQVGAQAPTSLGAGKVSVDALGDRFQSVDPTTGFGAFLGRTRNPKKLPP
jgi:hypothetical protein